MDEEKSVTQKEVRRLKKELKRVTKSSLKLLWLGRTKAFAATKIGKRSEARVVEIGFPHRPFAGKRWPGLAGTDDYRVVFPGHYQLPLRRSSFGSQKR
jgi:hypothetical protein